RDANIPALLELQSVGRDYRARRLQRIAPPGELVELVLRLIFVEMGAASVKTGVHIALGEYIGVLKEGKSLSDYAHLNEAAKNQ
ncbi:hypothetical protein ACCS64_38955, partial [Rhizobium ruizarguesonis]